MCSLFFEATNSSTALNQPTSPRLFRDIQDNEKQNTDLVFRE